MGIEGMKPLCKTKATMKSEYKWMATKGERNQATVGFGFFTKREAQEFASRENRRHNSGWVVVKVSTANNPKFL